MFPIYIIFYVSCAEQVDWSGKVCDFHWGGAWFEDQPLSNGGGYLNFSAWFMENA
jgi:hypothetical protein